MDTTNRILNRGGFAAALICLFVSACGPNGGGDSGMMTDAGPPTGDSGPDRPDAYVPLDAASVACSRHEDCTESGYYCVVQDSAGVCAPSCPGFGTCGDLYPGTFCRSAPTITGGGNLDVCLTYTPPECTAAEIASRTPGCGEQYDLPEGMGYDDSAMLASCMTELSASTWSYVGGSGCGGSLFREGETGHWMLNLGCGGDLPYGGLYRLGADGTWYGNFGNATMAGEQGNHARLMPVDDCRQLNGEFYRGGETTPYRLENYWRE
jgi:hypothetical protein